MTSNIVVAGTDGSEPSLRAVEWAAREAALHARPQPGRDRPRVTSGPVRLDPA